MLSQDLSGILLDGHEPRLIIVNQPLLVAAAMEPLDITEESLGPIGGMYRVPKLNIELCTQKQILWIKKKA